MEAVERKPVDTLAQRRQHDSLGVGLDASRVVEAIAADVIAKCAANVGSPGN